MDILSCVGVMPSNRMASPISFLLDISKTNRTPLALSPFSGPFSFPTSSSPLPMRQSVWSQFTAQADAGKAKPSSHGHGHGHGHGYEAESAFKKFLVSGTVAWTFELICGHYLEFLKIAKQTSELSYTELTKRMVQHKGIIGILDGYFPWGSIQCFVKGASFGFGQALGRSFLQGRVPDHVAEVLSGGVGGGVQGIMLSPLLLLKTRVMTDPRFRSSGGMWSTTVASTKVGLDVIRNEGLGALMKGSIVFSSKRVLDWTTRFFFAEVVTQYYSAYKNQPLTFTEKSMCSLMGGVLSATATIPMDVLVATVMDAKKAGQKVKVLDVWKEKMSKGGITGLVQYSCKGYVARVAHVALTTMLMKEIASAVYKVFN